MRTSTPPAALAAERRAAVSAIRFAAPLHAPEAGLSSLPTLARFDEAVWRADCDGEPVGEKVLSHVLDAVNERCALQPWLQRLFGLLRADAGSGRADCGRTCGVASVLCLSCAIQP